MRIISGMYRGRRIRIPENSDARPTTDRVKESMMSSIVSHTGGFEDLVVCDAFAGSGSLGLEALSRGASKAVFFDSDKNAIRRIESTIVDFGIHSTQARCATRDVMRTGITDGNTEFDLVFLDPPYAYDSEEVLNIVAKAKERGALSEEALIVYEHDGHEKPEAIDASMQEYDLKPISRKRYGKIYVDYISAS